MEELNKTQIVLLTLLVSFVTSIATGIATASLMERAPADVTRVIDRVVERTVEMVSPTLSSSPAASIITKEKTVVVREEEAITKAAGTAEKSLVRLFTQDSFGNDAFFAMGFVVSKEGMIATDADAVTNEGIYTAKLADGTRLVVRTIAQNEVSGIALLQLLPPQKNDGTQGQLPVLDAVVFADSGAARLGQTVLAVSGIERDAVSLGIIASIVRDSAGDVATSSSHTAAIAGFQTTLTSEGLNRGTPLFNLLGEVIGISHGNAGVFVPSNDIVVTVETRKKPINK